MNQKNARPTDSGEMKSRPNRFALAMILMPVLLIGALGWAFLRKGEAHQVPMRRVEALPAQVSAPMGSGVGAGHAQAKKSEVVRKSASRGKKAASPPPATSIVSWPDEVEEKDGACAYRAQGYCFLANREVVRAALPVRLPDGKRAEISMKFEELTVGGKPVAQRNSEAPSSRREERTVFFKRGAVEERYVLRQSEFEQDFVIRELPEQRGEIRASISVQSNLAAPPDGSRADELVFQGPGEISVTVSKAVVIDAAGRKLPLELAFAGGKIELSVPASWVAEASLPITIDPVVGSRFPITGPDTNQFFDRHAVAYGSTPNEWMVVWEDDPPFPGESNIYSQRIGADGTLLGTRTLVSTAAHPDVQPMITYSPALNQYLVVWLEYSSVSGANPDRVVGRFLNADGSGAAPEFLIATLTEGIPPAVVAGDGINSVAVATDGINSFYVAVVTASPASIRGFLLSNSGATISQPNPRDANGSAMNGIDIAYANQEYMVTWREGNPASQMARGMNRSGSFLTGATTVAANVGRISVSGSTNRFLFGWNSSDIHTIWGRVALANSAGSLAWGSGTFVIASNATHYVQGPSAAFSSTSNVWFVSNWRDNNPIGSLWDNLVSASGGVSTEEEYVPSDEWAFASRVSWNSATNDVLSVYVRGSTQAHPGFTLMGVRYNLGGSSAPPPPPSGLLGRWRFDEGSGLIAHDSSGKGNDGTLQNGVAWTGGKSGTAVSMNGTNQYISLPATGMPASNGAQTISWWMNYPSIPSSVQCVIGLTNDSAGSALQCGFRNGQVTVWKYGGGVLAQAPAPAPGVWHNFVYTFDLTTHRLYVDGLEINATTAEPQTAIADKLEFGRWSGGSEYYSGLLDEVSIYGDALSPTDVANLAADPSIEAYFKFNEATGTFTADSSGNGHDGTLGTGVTWGPGRSATAGVFDGSGSVSCVLGNGLPANNANQTISWWMNYPSTGGVQAVVCLTNPGQNSALQCGFRNGQVTIWNWGGNTLVAGTAPSTNAWHHFAYTLSGNVHTLYVDGVPVSSSQGGAQTAPPSRLDFGVTPGWGENFVGKLDEVKIYSRALSAADIAALASSFTLEAYFKFDEGTGASTADSSGNGHDGTLNGVNWAVGPSGYATNFTGSGDISCVVGNGLPANNAEQTISWWMNIPSASNTQAAVCLTNPGQNSAVQCGLRNNQVTVWNWGGNTLVSAAPPSLNTWHQFAYTFDGTTHRLYVDGLIANTSTAGAQTATPARLDFGVTPGWGENFVGKLDEVRIYSRTLSATEIASLAVDPSFAAYFKFDEGGGVGVADSSGHGHDGTLSPNTAWVDGISGNAVSLNVSGYAACAVRTGLPANNALQTISWWMFVYDNPFDIECAIDLHNDALTSAVQCGFRNGNVTVWSHGGNVLAQATPPLAVEWHHYAYTFDGQTHRLYVDGALANTGTAAPQTAPVASLSFGRWNGGPAEYFTGYLDEVRIYTRTLSDAEIAALSVPPPPLPTNLTGVPGNQSAALSWVAPQGGGTYTYKVFQSTVPGVYGNPVQAGVTATSYAATGLTNGVTYYFVVRATDAGGHDSDSSNEVFVIPNVPPTAPTLLTPTPGDRQVTLSWTAVPNAQSYTLFRSETSGFLGVPVATTGSTSVANGNLENGTTYYYHVKASNSVGSSPASNEQSATPSGGPNPPSNLSATGGSLVVHLSWTGPSGATSYNIFRGTVNGGPYPTVVATGFTGGTQYDDTTVANGSTYFYVVTALNAGGESARSNQAQATPGPTGTTLAPPTNVRTTAYFSCIDVEWTPSASPNVVGYRVYRKQQNDPSWPSTPLHSGVVTSSKFRDNSPATNITYQYRVTAVGN